MSYVRCSYCKWAHFEMSRDAIIKWKKDWEEFWPTLDAEGKEAYGVLDGPPSTKEYYECFRCGGSYKNMVDIEDNDPELFGHTIQPIAKRDEEYVD